MGSGHRVIALDLPGHGKASASKPLAARGSKGGDLILAILRTFICKRACMTDAGGASAFLRAFKQAPTLFAAHHILLNPITTEAGGSVRDISFQATPNPCPSARLLFPHLTADFAPFEHIPCSQEGLQLKLLLERHGAGLWVLMADGWGHTPRSPWHCGAFFELMGSHRIASR